MLDKLTSQVAMRFRLAENFAFRLGKYKAKKLVPKANGEGKTTVYIYSDKQIAERNRKKAKRLEKLRKNIKHLRAQVRRDLRSDDPEKALTALAVALMDATAERVGSPASAAGDLNSEGEAHYGVTQWQKSHISFGKGGATIRYVGKSGVKHKKTVTDAAVVKALRKAHACLDGDEDCIFKHDTGSIGGKQVNDFLRAFKISAKDLRGWHANDKMQAKLKEIRSKDGSLPEDKKEREAQLKKEWKRALAETAKEIGHEPETLSGDYLVPGLEEGYLKDGSVLPGMTKKSQDTYDRRLPEEL